MIRSMTCTTLLAVLAVLASTGVALGQVGVTDEFRSASGSVQEKLEGAIGELAALRELIADEKVPMSRELANREAELSEVRDDYQQVTRLLDGRTLDLSNLGKEITAREDEASYLSGLLGDYIRTFESRLHIAEVDRYEGVLEEARLAPENSNLTQYQVFERQAEVLSASLDRLDQALGGVSFPGTAVASDGLVKDGSFVMLGPAALFRSDDGQHVGTAEQRLGSLEPAQVGFSDLEDTAAASALVSRGVGEFPFDPTLGNAHKVAATEESFIEHAQKGGAVMVPIVALAVAALLVALYKWMRLAFVRKPSKEELKALLDAVEAHDREAAQAAAAAVSGPAGEMLQAGVEHIEEPRDLIEEVMFERLLTTRLKLEKMLPFVSIAAASAPLLGLLGTVTGIINTFKLITVFGSGDVKSLSGGISEALITTEFGLIVAIPSLLLHAFLSRKAKGIVNSMESAAVGFVNQISKSPFGRRHRAPVAAGPVTTVPESTWEGAELDLPLGGDGAREDLHTQVEESLRVLLRPMVREALADELRGRPATKGGDREPAEATTP